MRSKLDWAGRSSHPDELIPLGAEPVAEFLANDWFAGGGVASSLGWTFLPPRSDHRGHAVVTNRLEVPAFETRLRAQLEDVRRELQATWLAVADLGLEHAPLAPTWRSSSGVPCPEEPPGAELFQRLVFGTSLLAHDLGAGVPLPRDVPRDDCVVTALDVVPRLTAHGDACLLVAPAACAVDPAFDEARRTLELELSRERRARLAQVVLEAVEQAADPFELSDREGRLFYVNRAWEQFTGYARAEVLGATAGRLFRDPQSSPHDPHFYRFAMAELHAGRPWLGAISGRVNDGKRVFAEAHVAPFEVAPGLHGHVAVRRDLTARSSRDQALLAAHREFRNVLAAITDGVCVLRGELVYFTNSALSRILGLPEEQLSGRRFSELLHEDDRAQFEQEHRRQVSRVRALRADGGPRFIEISSAGEISFEGDPATILLVRDTTDYQLAQEELARAEKLSALGAMAAGVAHEINNPLAYVALNLELVRENGRSSLPPPEIEALDEAIEGVSRMREIAHELHTFSGRDEPGPPVAVDLTRAVTSALNLVNNEIRLRAQLVRELEPNLLAFAREGQLVQVFVNVLVNAVQAIPSPSEQEQTLRVVTRAGADGTVEMSVTDSGVGIPPHLLPHLFDPFSTSKRRGEGSGLGLAICKRIIDDLDGSIEVHSEVGRGTTVTISLPEAPALALPTLPPVTQRGSTRLPRLRVLVVEDEPAIARALERLLDMHRITRAPDGRRALALLETSADFDVVLCDLMMPGITGAALYRIVLLRWPELAPRFVFMTGGAVTPDSREFLDSFPGQVLWKPFTPEVLDECIQRVGRHVAEPRASGTRATRGVSTPDDRDKEAK
jgi:PAS domain S-box-containing protein